MSINIYFSQSTLALQNALFKILEQKQAQGTMLFAPPTIVLPIQQISSELNFALAQRAGVSAGLRYVSTNQFLNELIEKELAPDSELIEKQLLTAALLFESNEMPQNAEERRAKIDEAIGLASLWSKYAMTRPKVMIDWRENPEKTHLNDFPEKAEKLFSTRYAALFREGALSKTRNSWKIIAQLYEADSFKAEVKNSEKKCYIFYDPEAFNTVFLEILSIIAQKHEVYILAFNPCAKYWDDLHPQKLSKFAEKNEAEQEDFLSTLFAPAQCFPLQQWGNLARGAIRSLVELCAQCETKGTNSSFDNLDSDALDAAEQADTTSLKRLQNAILKLEDISDVDMSKAFEFKAGQSADNSMACREFDSIEEEIIWVANDIFKRISKDPDLRFSDFCLYLPSTQFASYAPNIDFAFNHHNSIPYNQEALQQWQNNPALCMLAALLDLHSSKLSREAMLKWLNQEYVIPDDCAPLWARWSRDLGVFYGESEELFAPNDAYGQSAFHWEQAIERLFLSHFFDEASTNELELIALSAEEKKSATSFMHYLRASIADYRYIQNHEHSLSDWANILELCLEAYANPSAKSDADKFDSALKLLRDLRRMDIDSKRHFSFDFVRDLLFAHFAHDHGAEQYQPAKMAIKTLEPQKISAYRHIYLCGLDNDCFPRTSSPNFDIRLALRRPGEASAFEEDALALLKACLNAKDSISLSYAKLNENGEDIPASSLLIQFAHYYAECMQTDAKNKQSQDKHFVPLSKSELTRKMRNFRREHKIVLPITSPTLAPTTIQPQNPIVCELRVFSDFLQNPNEAYKKHILKSYTAPRLENLLSASTEPFNHVDDKLLTFLMREAMLCGNYDESFFSAKLKEITDSLRAFGRYPDSYFSQIQDEKLLVQLQIWSNEIANLAPKHAKLKFYKLGQGSWQYQKYYRKFSQAQAQTLSPQCASPALQIEDELAICDERAVYYFQARYKDSSPPTRNLLAPLIHALTILARTDSKPKTVHVLFYNDRLALDISQIHKKQAQAYLDALSNDLLSAKHEIVLKAYDKTRPLQADEIEEQSQFILENRYCEAQSLSLSPVAKLSPNSQFVSESLQHLAQNANTRYSLINELLSTVNEAN
ncbi:MAG: exodeoxyribonuclease V subunit gamma [Bradymonadia bacterium]